MMRKAQLASQVLLRILILLPFLPWSVGIGSARKVGDAGKAGAKPLCEILQEAEHYDGAKISVSATYRVAYEASTIYCLSCSESGEVWVEFDSVKSGEKAGKTLDRLVHTRGTVNGVFIGIFHSGGRYGHLSAYRYELSVGAVRDLKLVDRLGVAPASLSQSSRAKVCK